MGRPPVIPVEQKTRIVLSVLAGEVTIAEAARREKVSEQSIGRWKADFLEAGKTGLAAGRSGPSTREQQLEAEVAELTQARGGASGGSRLEEVCRGPLGPFEDLEVTRVEAGMPTSRGCERFGVPELTWRRWQAKARQDRPPKGPWPQPARDAARPLVTKHALAKPAWEHRKIWAMTRHDGHRVSQATVLRILRDDGLILPLEYQKQRRDLARARKDAFARTPTGPNQVWQLDFSEFETSSGGTWRLAG